MPKVIIAEKDLTSAEAIQYDDYIVFIPGTKEFTIGSKTYKAGEEEYFTSASKFKEALDISAASDWDLPTKMAYRLLSLGMTVLYRVIGSQNELDNESFWTQYADKGEYNLRFLTCGGYASVESAQGMITCASDRGDAIALVDIPDGLVAIDLPLVGISFTSDSVLAVSGGAFDPSGLKVEAIYRISGVAESSEAITNVSFSYAPAVPSSEIGLHEAVVTASWTDSGNESWTTRATMMYEVEAPESGD